jgi:glc operon protein GlcG
MLKQLKVGLAVALVSLATASAEAQLAEKKVITLAVAHKMVAAAEAEAVHHHWAGVIAIVDDGGWLILEERMDNAAFTASVALAPGKGAYRRFVQETEPGPGGCGRSRSYRFSYSR